MWGLSGALEMIRLIQPVVKTFDYHVLLGGGVLNRGLSEHDLDLYFIPFSERAPRPVELRAYLETVLGTEYTLGGPDVRIADILSAYPEEPTWVNGRFTYRQGSIRTDVFIA